MTDSSEPKGTTPEKWSSYTHPTKIPGAFSDPTKVHAIYHGRSGNLISVGENADSEFIMIQHRSGSTFQMNPDGELQFTSHNGMKQIVFGENRMLVTGAWDVVVKGEGSLKVDGNYRTTVHGDMETTVQGNYVISAKNMTQDINGDMNIKAKALTAAVEGNTLIGTRGITAITSDGGLSLASTGDSVSVVAASTLGMKSGAAFQIQSGADMSMKISGKLQMGSGGISTIKAGGNIAFDGSRIDLNSGKASDPGSYNVSFQAPHSPTPEPTTV